MKFQVIELDCLKLDVKILATLPSFETAVAFVNKFVEEQFDVDSGYVKVNYESSQSVQHMNIHGYSPRK
jgi:hypothetical protein